MTCRWDMLCRSEAGPQNAKAPSRRPELLLHAFGWKFVGAGCRDLGAGCGTGPSGSPSRQIFRRFRKPGAPSNLQRLKSVCGKGCLMDCPSCSHDTPDRCWRWAAWSSWLDHRRWLKPTCLPTQVRRLCEWNIVRVWHSLKFWSPGMYWVLQPA